MKTYLILTYSRLTSKLPSFSTSISYFLDVNETPTMDCNMSFHVLNGSSNGSVIGQMKAYDADNEAYYRSDKRKQRKQLLSYRLEPENSSWPFDMTDDGVLYLEGVINL